MLKYLEENRTRFVYIPLIVYWLILLTATTIPVDSVPSFGVGDKLKHFGAYFILASLLYFTLLFQQKSSYLRTYAAIFTVVIAVTYGALDEIHQMFVPGRFAEFLDWAADFAGSLCGALAMQWFTKWKKFVPEKIPG